MKLLCKVMGCSNEAKARGLCQKHYDAQRPVMKIKLWEENRQKVIDFHKEMKFKTLHHTINYLIKGGLLWAKEGKEKGYRI